MVEERLERLMDAFLVTLPGVPEQKELARKAMLRWKEEAIREWEEIALMVGNDPEETAGSLERSQVAFLSGYIVAKRGVLLRHNLAL
jgi:hypothetical protein